MIAVIFEVIPDPDQKDTYLASAATMKPFYENIDGFISVERFESLTQPGKLLSLSFWRDEAALAEWRNTMQHRAMQTKGRELYFENYRLRVSEVIRDYGMHERAEVPEDSRDHFSGS